MSVDEAKTEIISLLDQLPDKHIPAILEYMKHFMNLLETDEESAIFLEEIMEEDHNLLKRLAE